MQQMIETHLPVSHGARVVGDDLLTPGELPRGGEVLVAGGLNGGPAFGGCLV